VIQFDQRASAKREEQRAKSKGQRAKGKEQRAKREEQRAKREEQGSLLFALCSSRFALLVRCSRAHAVAAQVLRSV
jgi:hypothetical protein